MKIKSLSLSNFTGFSNVKVNFDENITYLVGPNGAGKSTIGLNGIWFVMKGIAEKGDNVLVGERFRFIGDDGASARGIIKLIDEKLGEITIKRTMTKSGTKLEFIAPDGMFLDQQWLNDLFNLYMIAPMRFAELSPKEQAIALGIDLSAYDKAIKELKQEYTEINAVYRSLQPGEKPVVIEPVTNLDETRDALNSKRKEHATLADHIRIASSHIKEMDVIDEEIERLTKRKAMLTKEATDALGVDPYKFDVSTKRIDWAALEHDISKLEQVISNASANAEQVALLKKWEHDTKLKEDKAQELEQNKKKQALREEAKLEHLKSMKLPFKNLTIDEEGGLMFNGRPIKAPYFSSGELLTIIPRLMGSRNPELKYIYIQHFDLLDEQKQEKLIADLTSAGFQLVIEKVGKNIDKDGNIIILEDMQIINQEAENETNVELDEEDLVI
jgi:uncharacterized protein YhaN